MAELILQLCVEPRGFEEILKLAFDECSLTLDFQQYVLVGSTIKSFLAWHLDSGPAVTAEFTDNRLLLAQALSRNMEQKRLLPRPVHYTTEREGGLFMQTFLRYFNSALPLLGVALILGARRRTS